MKMQNKKINYSFEKAIEIIKNSKKRKFEESIDISIQLTITPNKKNIIVKGHTILPHKIGKDLKIAAFLVNENEINEAKKSHIDIILQEKNINDFNKKQINFDLLISTPTSIVKIGKLNKILGAKNLMPDVKYGTITTNISETVSKLKNNYIKFKNDKNDIIHSILGKISSDTQKLKENAEMLINDIKKQKAQNCKSIIIKKIHISSTMGQSAEINLNSLNI